MAERSLVLYIATENTAPEINARKDRCSTNISLSSNDY